MTEQRGRNGATIAMAITLLVISAGCAGSAATVDTRSGGGGSEEAAFAFEKR